MNAARLLLVPSIALAATWALIGITAIASFVGPMAFIAAVVTWPLLVPLSAFCAFIGCYVSIREPKNKNKILFISYHLLSLALAIGTGCVAYTYGRIGIIPTAS